MWWNYDGKPFNPSESRNKAAAIIAENGRTVEDRVAELVEGPHLSQTLLMLAREIDAIKAHRADDK